MGRSFNTAPKRHILAWKHMINPFGVGLVKSEE